jgi:hypothetical protein
LWSVARYDLGLSWDEFEDLTPAMFMALCVRRNVRFKHDRFAAGMVASATYNCHRTEKDSPVFTAWDFVRNEEEDEAHAQTRKIKEMIRKAIGVLPSNTPRIKLLQIRQQCINSLLRQGRKDAEVLFDECWPMLKPKAGE